MKSSMEKRLVRKSFCQPKYSGTIFINILISICCVKSDAESQLGILAKAFKPVKNISATYIFPIV